VAAGMKKVEVVFRISNKHSFVHTTARREATAAGVRYYIVQPDIAEDLKRNVPLNELNLIIERTEKIAARLSQSKVAKLTTSKGTCLTLNLSGRNGVPLHPMSGVIRSLDYYSEAAIAPVEGSAEGTLVADLCIVQWGHLLEMPLQYTVKAGKIVNISGTKEDEARMQKLITLDGNANNIAELGIGTSHLIPLPMQGRRRDAGRLGTAHIGFGRNRDIGGALSSQLHIDNLMSRVSLDLDGTSVIKDGVSLF
jgi:2,5-dihydroxypyridine 5,6-dioxygenase